MNFIEFCYITLNDIGRYETFYFAHHEFVNDDYDGYH